MPYLIIAHDHPGVDSKREELREAHRAYLAAQGTKLLVSGALLSADSNKIEGGASLLDTEDFDEAVRFEAQDPYAKAGIRARPFQFTLTGMISATYRRGRISRRPVRRPSNAGLAARIPSQRLL